MKLLLVLFITMSSTFGESLEERIQNYQLVHEQKRKARAQLEYKENQKKIQAFNQDLKESGLEKHAIKVGQRVPNYKFPDKTLKDYLAKGPVILKFYRGHWCPYCVLELKEYQRTYNTLKKKGVQLIVFTPDKNKYISKTKRDHKLDFPIYSDPENTIARSLGLTFTLNDEVKKLYAQFGIDLSESQGNDKNELPMPATLVINKEGRVTYAFYSVDYTKRAEPLEVQSEALKLL